MSNEVNPSAPDQEMDLPSLIKIAWRYKFIVIGLSILGGVVATVRALTAPEIFRAEAVVSQVHESNGSGLGALASQFGGLASLAGLNLGIGGRENQEPLAILKSRHLVEEFILRNGLVTELFLKPKKKPTLWQAVDKFQKAVLTITDNKRDGTVAITINWTNPHTAARWANGFVALANEFLRARALNDARRNIDYLNGQIAHTNAVEVQKVMYNLIENETKTAMLANGRIEYAFAVVDPAVAPEVRTSPKRTLMVLIGLILGGLAGIAVALVRNRIVQSRLHDGPAPQ